MSVVASGSLPSERSATLRLVGLQLIGDQRPALRVPRHDDGEQIRPRRPHLQMRGGDDVVLARMGARGKPHGAACERGAEFAPARQVGGRRRRVGLEIADVERARHAELGEALGKPVILSEHESEGREDRTAQARPPPPALEGGGRHAPVDQHQRNGARLGLQHEVRPDLRLHQHGEIGAPMLQEALHEVLIVERDILMQHALRQPRAREPRRGDGGGGEQHAQLGALGGDASRSPAARHWPRRRSPHGTRRGSPAGAARWRHRSAQACAPAPPCRAACANRGSRARTARPGASAPDRP